MLDQAGYHAATRQSWKRDSIRVAIAELRGANPQATEDRLVQLYAERMKADDDLLQATAEYAVINALNSMERKAPAASRTAPAPQERAARAQEVEKMVSNIKDQITLLNMEMPNGKRMRWCTGAEMMKFGGAFTKIGKKVGSTKNVGTVLDEKQVRALMG